MAFRVRPVEYFYLTVEDRPGEAYRVLTGLADSGVNLLALTAVPIGPTRTQMSLFPEDSGKMRALAVQLGMRLDGPYRAILVQGDDELGALATVHDKLAQAGVNVYASTGVADGQGSYGYVLYVRPEQYETATRALHV